VPELPVLPARNIRAEPEKSTEWTAAGISRGAAHCGACHTPKNLFAATGRAFGGGLVLGWFAPRLDGAERSGLKPGASVTSSNICRGLQRAQPCRRTDEVVANSTSKMSDADIRAIAVYLKDLPAESLTPL
jgi:mono/diheme cytochrome c family protein